MHNVTKNQKKQIARNIRRELNGKFPDYRRNRRLSSLLGVSPATVARWANGERTPDLMQLNRLAETLGVALHRLCGCSGKYPVQTKSLPYNVAMNVSIIVKKARRNNVPEDIIRAELDRAMEFLDGIMAIR